MDKDKIKALLKELEDEGSKEGDESKEGTDEKSLSIDALKLAEKIGDKIVSTIEEKTQRKDDGTLTKLFTPKGGLEAVKYPSNDELANLSKEDKILVWFKAMINKDRDNRADFVFKALIEGTDAQGGYLVPEEFRAEVFRILPDMAVMRKLARVIPMTTDTLNLNTLSARPYAYWTSEYASKSTTSAEFGRVTLQPNDLVCLLPVTHQLIADANIDVIRFVVELFAEAIAAAEDDAFFTGSGSGQPQGIASCSSTGSIASGGLLNFDDIISAIYSRKQRIRQAPSAAFVGNRRVIEILRKVKDSNGRYIWTPGASSDVANRGPEMVYGYPIHENNDLSEHVLWFGDWKYYLIGDRQSLAVETTREGGDAWRRNATEVKAVERIDGKCVLGSAFVQITGI